MKLTEHFTIEEMQRSNTAIRLGLQNICPDLLRENMLLVAQRLEAVRAYFKAPVRVLSCYRSPSVNKAVGGSETSAHLFAQAADFTVDGISVSTACDWCSINIPDYDQIIFEFGESGWCHMGFTSKEPRRQLLTAVKVGGKTVYRKGLDAS
jgi:hypothetical protein